MIINYKKELVKNIANLSVDEHIEIYKIIKNSTDKYTINNNGIFVNLSIMDDNILEEIKKFVDFCIEDKDRLKKKEEIINFEKTKMFESNSNINNKDDITNEVNNNEEPINKVKKTDEDEDEDIMEGTKISLKRLKPKYSGVKAKIIKNYKQNNTLQTIVYKKNKNICKDKNCDEGVYNIGEEVYYNEEENIDESDIEENSSVNEE